MDINELFGGQGTSEAVKRAAIMNVVSVMAADGRVDPRELATLELIRQRVGISKEELDKIIRNPRSVKFVRPSSEEERRAQLVDMVFMMMADGKIEKSELEVVVRLGIALGFNPDQIRIVIENVILRALHANKARGQIIVDEAWAQWG
jgi:uncharacterized tellurite resistance protein B-like protein